MNDYKSHFIAWYFNEFRHTTLYADMVDTVENSPWHREQNVGVHTDMVVAQYLGQNTSPTWTKSELLGAFAIVFHDVGKPIAEETLTREDGTPYRRYSGHEQKSAREWENWASANWTRLVTDFTFAPKDIWAVAWVIEHHLPYGLVKKDKIALLLLSANHSVGLPVFFSVLRADCHGRISDGHDAKKANVEAYIEEMNNAWINEVNPNDRTLDKFSSRAASMKPTVYMLIGPSHVGKSTYIRNTFNEDAALVFSWDKLRTDWYSPDPRIAFEMYKADPTFRGKAHAVYVDLLKTGKNVIVDNTNLTPKIRRPYIDEAKRKGYRVVAILLPIARDVLLARSGTREDNPVPPSSIAQQNNAMQMPYFGEFNSIEVISHNLQ